MSAAPLRGLLLDLDDTLYDYAPAEAHARGVVLEAVAATLGLPRGEVERLWDGAKKKVKGRLGARGSAHSRLLYLTEIVHAASRVDALGHVRAWERTFWGEFLQQATLRPGARALLEGFRARGGKVAIVTDLTLEVQLWKLEAFGLFGLIDALAVSEEVAHEKPAADLFLLAIERLGVSREACVVVGDNPEKDGEGARALGLPYFQALSSERPGGEGLEAIARALEVAS